MATTLIKKGTLITASDTFQADILIRDGKIALIGQGLDANGRQVVDAAGKLIMPEVSIPMSILIYQCLIPFPRMIITPGIKLRLLGERLR